MVVTYDCKKEECLRTHNVANRALTAYPRVWLKQRFCSGLATQMQRPRFQKKGHFIFIEFEDHLTLDRVKFYASIARRSAGISKSNVTEHGHG